MLNKVMLMGRLTKDPETRYTTTNNTLVCSFTLAVNRRYAKEGEERQADFIQIIAWSKLGEFISKYFAKGRQVVVCGRIQTRTWDDDQNKKHYVTEVIADEAYFADAKKDSGNSSSTAQSSSPAEENFSSESSFTVVSDEELPF